jgi:hypothetical protein
MDEKILRQIMTQLTVSVPVAGKALGELCKNTSYAVAAKTGKIGGLSRDDGGRKTAGCDDPYSATAGPSTAAKPA